ncbi:putative phosphatidylinositol 4 kinase [Babesia divergens]|uniref:1-phosphatidylinositol 4-kinase n=1 Tax=Babesia divergens TaxID=32595 RepID=A0AAD9LHK5_BABDI|nr:putative phosphatidylinositol 4 kinase [Babesia divergens]
MAEEFKDEGHVERSDSGEIDVVNEPEHVKPEEPEESDSVEEICPVKNGACDEQSSQDTAVQSGVEESDNVDQDESPTEDINESDRDVINTNPEDEEVPSSDKVIAPSAEEERAVSSEEVKPALDTVEQEESSDNNNLETKEPEDSVVTVDEVRQMPVMEQNISVIDVEKSTKEDKDYKKESKKRTSKAVVGTSENPIDITDLSVDSGSLLQLYQNDYFDAYMHMHHLYHKKEAGVHKYLVNLLYSKRTNEEIMFYLPQLCQMSISKYGKSPLHRFLLDKASTSMHFALKLSWFYQAIIADKASKLGHLSQKMTQETEMAVVNCKLISPVPSSNAPVEDIELNVCSKGLHLRRALVKGIRERNDDPFSSTTDVDLLDRPKFSNQLLYITNVLTCPQSKVKLPTPCTKIGNPLDLEIQPYVQYPDEMQYELERLMMKQRRLDYFNMLSNFVKLSMDVSKLLTAEPKRDAREPLLEMFAKSMNEWMLLQRCTVAAYEESFAYRGLSFPMKRMGYDKNTLIPFQFLRIVEDEIKIFFSRKRAPFVFYFEIANLDEDVKQITNELGEEAVNKVTFNHLYVFDAIVKDLLSAGLLDIADVERIKNPLECIRHVLGMLPNDVLERFQRTNDQLGSGFAASSIEIDDLDAVSVASSVKDLTLDSKSGLNDDGDVSKPISRTQSTSDSKHSIIDQMSKEEARAVVFPEILSDKKERLRRNSPYGGLKSWNVRAVVLKGGDDLRQEYMVNQLLILFQDIFISANLPLWLRPMEILVTGPNCGIIEFLHDTCSVDVIKRKFNVESIAKVFDRIYADNIFEARKNFIESHAAYSIISYLLHVKDRHNGNMLLDKDGHIVHIDYGFCLSNTPGNINFETSPFKLTKEYVDIIGGESSDNFAYFRTLVIRGLLEARKHMDRIVLLVEMMSDAHKMPCFAAGTSYTLDMFKDRFMLHLSEDVCIDRIVAMIEASVNNFRTVQYDNFQRLTNGIK